jgi:hypothetical protein
MDLGRDEHSILAFFPSCSQALSAMVQLKNDGFVMEEGAMQLDRVSQFGVVNDSHYNNPINNALTNHGPTLYSNSMGVDDGPNPLLAANDTEMGRGINNDNLAGGEAFMVTLVTSNDKIQQAVNILKSNGGRV